MTEKLEERIKELEGVLRIVGNAGCYGYSEEGCPLCVTVDGYTVRMLAEKKHLPTCPIGKALAAVPLEEKPKKIICSFCGKTRQEVRQMVAANKQPEVVICDECVGLSVVLIDDDCVRVTRAARAKREPTSPAKFTSELERFCLMHGRELKRAHANASGHPEDIGLTAFITTPVAADAAPVAVSAKMEPVEDRCVMHGAPRVGTEIEHGYECGCDVGRPEAIADRIARQAREREALAEKESHECRPPQLVIDRLGFDTVGVAWRCDCGVSHRFVLENGVRVWVKDLPK